VIATRVSTRRSKPNGEATAKKPPRRPADIPRSLLEFQGMFPDEAACADYMERVRWPDGFLCGACGAGVMPYRFTATPALLQCRVCRHKVSLTSGTVMHATKQPLHVWFWAAYLVTTQTPGMSALQFQRQLGIVRYETAFQLFHKLRAGMVRPEHDAIGDPYAVEVDEAFVGGRTKGKGRGVTDAPLVVAAVEVRTRASPKKGRLSVYAGRLRLRQIVSRERAELEPFVRENVLVGSTVRTDGCNGYDYLRAFGYDHQRLVLDGDTDLTAKHLPMVHIVFSNLKTWLRGTHHGVSPQHLQAYLNEYVFRFNRRFYPMTSFASVLGIGTVTTGPTYDGLYGGEYVHKQNDEDAAKALVRPGPRKGVRRVWWAN
jgi:transposase-like protein